MALVILTLFLKTELKRQPKFDLIEQGLANLLVDEDIVGPEIAEFMRRIPPDQRVQLKVVTGHEANSIIFEQTVPFASQWIFTGHPISERVQEESYKAVNKGFRSARPHRSFSFSDRRHALPSPKPTIEHGAIPPTPTARPTPAPVSTR
ncbi:hypothetical protein IH979_00490 [Patescibacteria group bacterium]|nr:hypothetical protein [Patescibacteria group bacterium]